MNRMACEVEFTDEFDPRRAAILMIGGDKTGNDRWYETFVPMADRIFSRHLEQLREEEER
jgi:hypothetical protein